MSENWSLANGEKPEGRLGDVTRFIPGPVNPVACSVFTPLEYDKRHAIRNMPLLLSDYSRSLEIWWNGYKKRLDIVLVAGKDDMDMYQDRFATVYPGADFEPLQSPKPAWAKPNRRYHVINLGPMHGHYATLYNQDMSHSIISGIARIIQDYEFGWFQVVFTKYDCTKTLGLFLKKLNKRYHILHKKQETMWDTIRNRKAHDHYEMGYDLDNNYQALRAHATAKMQGPHFVASMTGLLYGGEYKDFPVDHIESAPIQGIQSRFEHLTTYQYDYNRFYSRGGKSSIKVPGKKGNYHRFAIFSFRMIPLGFNNETRNEYFDTNWYGRYRLRRPLPRIIGIASELPLFAHLPDPTVPNLRTTRGRRFQPPPSYHDGANLGSFDAAARGGRAREGRGPGGA